MPSISEKRFCPHISEIRIGSAARFHRDLLSDDFCLQPFGEPGRWELPVFPVDDPPAWASEPAQMRFFIDGGRFPPWHYVPQALVWIDDPEAAARQLADAADGEGLGRDRWASRGFPPQLKEAILGYLPGATQHCIEYVPEPVRRDTPTQDRHAALALAEPVGPWCHLMRQAVIWTWRDWYRVGLP